MYSRSSKIITNWMNKLNISLEYGIVSLAKTRSLWCSYFCEIHIKEKINAYICFLFKKKNYFNLSNYWEFTNLLIDKVDYLWEVKNIMNNNKMLLYLKRKFLILNKYVLPALTLKWES